MPITPDASEALHTALARFMKTAHAAARHAPRGHDEVDAGAQMMLFKLMEQPRRISTLAEMTHCDVSTMSRQISALTELGLITKTHDLQDRRAWQVTLTDLGRDTVAAAQRQRAQWLTQVLTDWTDDEAATAAVHLNRLADGFAATLSPPGHCRPGTDPLTTPTTDTEDAHA